MVKIGTDLIEIERIKRSIRNPRFLSRVFSPSELRFFSQRSFHPATVAANFCVKEAFGKALGTGVRGFAFNEVSVLRDGMGAPYVLFDGNAKQLAVKSGLTFSVSISHTRVYATAVVVGYRANQRG